MCVSDPKLQRNEISYLRVQIIYLRAQNIHFPVCCGALCLYASNGLLDTLNRLGLPPDSRIQSHDTGPDPINRLGLLVKPGAHGGDVLAEPTDLFGLHLDLLLKLLQFVMQRLRRSLEVVHEE